MRPDEHEYKVMGLAPYAKQAVITPALEVIENICDVNGLRIVSEAQPTDLYAHLVEEWADQRLDNIAGAVQSYTERVACNLVSSIIKETCIRQLVISSGISMNVKMNKAIADLPEVTNMFVCGSGGDERLSLGGCYLMAQEDVEIIPLDNLYLGYDVAKEITELDIEALKQSFSVREDIGPAYIVALVAEGDIVAVIRGRAEIGARGLGNRSILAHPGRPESVRQINDAIKNRDFWMPFARSIPEEQRHEFLVNSKRISAPFLTMIFDTLPDRYNDIQAGSYTSDRTVRAQFVSKDASPEFHSLLECFLEATVIPALLNTSFNLHSKPIVNDLHDAIHTFENLGLGNLWIGGRVLLSKLR